MTKIGCEFKLSNLGQLESFPRTVHQRVHEREHRRAGGVLLLSHATGCLCMVVGHSDCPTMSSQYKQQCTEVEECMHRTRPRFQPQQSMQAVTISKSPAYIQAWSRQGNLAIVVTHGHADHGHAERNTGPNRQRRSLRRHQGTPVWSTSPSPWQTNFCLNWFRCSCWLNSARFGQVLLFIYRFLAIFISLWRQGIPWAKPALRVSRPCSYDHDFFCILGSNAFLQYVFGVAVDLASGQEVLSLGAHLEKFRP